MTAAVDRHQPGLSAPTGGEPWLAGTGATPAWRAQRLFWLIVGLAIALRLGVFVAAAIHPITNESGLPISPLYVHGIDYRFYQDTREFYFGEDLRSGWIRFAHAYGQFIRHFPVQRTELLLAPPLLPALYELFDYGPGHTLPFAVVYLLLACALVTVWLQWLANQGVSPFWLVLFALLPNPLWYMLNPSTDLLFAAFVSGFILFYWARVQSTATIAGWTLCLLGLALCRPNGVALIGFVGLDLLFLRAGWSVRRLAGLAAIGLFSLAAAMYYLPYFVMVQYSSTTSTISYFGLLQGDYLAGLFSGLPGFLDAALSWLALLGAKLLYFVGMRPSYSDLSWPLLLVRAAPGLVLLPGLLYGIFCAGWRLRLFLLLFLAPMLLSVSQERYNLAIQPLLFYLGTIAFAQTARLSRSLFAVAGGR